MLSRRAGRGGEACGLAGAAALARAGGGVDPVRVTELQPIPRSDAFRRCYGCGPANERGLRLHFDLDRAARQVVATWTPPPETAGYGRMVHGGVVAALVDEAMGWALWGLEQRVGVTAHLDLSYRRPALVGRPLTIVGWVEEAGQRGATVRAEVRDKRGRAAAAAAGDFRFIAPERVRDE